MCSEAVRQVTSWARFAWDLGYGVMPWEDVLLHLKLTWNNTKPRDYLGMCVFADYGVNHLIDKWFVVWRGDVGLNQNSGSRFKSKKKIEQ